MPDKIKVRAYVINLDEYSDIGTHWIALYVNNKTVTWVYNFGVEHIPNDFKKNYDIILKYFLAILLIH